MQNQHTKYPPIQHGALHFRGVHGIAWALYRRSFKGLLPLFLIFLFPVMVASFATTSYFVPNLDFGGFGNSYYPFFEMLPGLLGAYGVQYVLTLLLTFLLTPVYTGTAFLELQQCEEGRPGTFSQIIRHALPIGFRNYYTTYLANLLINYAFQLVTGFVSFIISMILLFPRLFSLAISGNSFSMNTLSGSIWVILLLTTVLTTVATAFTLFIFPVAIHENKRAFQAMGRSFQLAAKNYWRAFSAFGLYNLCAAILAALLIYMPAIYGTDMNGFPYIRLVTGILYSLAICFLTPFQFSLYTALYIDASSRLNRAKSSHTPHAPYTQNEHAGSMETADNLDGAAEPTDTAGPKESLQHPAEKFSEETSFPAQTDEGTTRI